MSYNNSLKTNLIASYSLIKHTHILILIYIYIYIYIYQNLA